MKVKRNPYVENMYVLPSETSYQQTNWIHRIQYLSYLQAVEQA